MLFDLAKTRWNLEIRNSKLETRSSKAENAVPCDPVKRCYFSQRTSACLSPLVAANAALQRTSFFVLEFRFSAGDRTESGAVSSTPHGIPQGLVSLGKNLASCSVVAAHADMHCTSFQFRISSFDFRFGVSRPGTLPPLPAEIRILYDRRKCGKLPECRQVKRRPGGFPGSRG